MFDYDYRCGPHDTADAALRSVAAAGQCAIVRVHHLNDVSYADVAVVDTTAMYLTGAQRFLEQYATALSEPPAPRGEATGYAMVLPPAGVACLVDQHGQTRTLALGVEFTDDPTTRAQIYEGLRALLDAETAIHTRAGRAFTDLTATPSSVDAPAPSHSVDEPARRRLPRS